MMGIPITRTGAEIRLGNAAFVIGMPCSGLIGLIALAGAGSTLCLHPQVFFGVSILCLVLLVRLLQFRFGEAGKAGDKPPRYRVSEGLP